MKFLKHKLFSIILLILISPIVIGDFRFSSFIYPLLWIGIPIIIYSLLPTRKSILVKALLVLTIIPYYLYTIVFVLKFIFCGYSQKDYKYINRRNHNIKLVGRNFACYGTTEDLVLYKEFSISQNIKIEIPYKTFVDYKNINIDTSIWKHINHFENE